MRLQSKPASCGPTALHNALMARGVRRSEDELAKLSGCTAAGTSSRGLLKAVHMIAIEHPGLKPGVISERRGDVAILKLLTAHEMGAAAILIVDDYAHWVASFGLLGRNVFHVADSANEELVLHYGPDDLLARWKPAGKGAYYGILL